MNNEFMRREFLPAACLGIVLLVVSGCGPKESSSSTEGQISVLLANAPATLTVNQSVSLTANVSNDSSNAGVDWSCSPSGACGSFNPAHTSSGGTTVFTAPGKPGGVTVTASAAAGSASASATITIIESDANARLNGPYVFVVQGINTNGTYTAAGTILADGRGNITAGEQDYADPATQAGPNAVTGKYTIGADGRGSLTLDVSNAALPNNGVETFSIAMVSNSHALIIQFDGNETSSGSLDRQASGAADPGTLNGPYAFLASGYDVVNQGPVALGGVGRLSVSSGQLTNGKFFANDSGNYIHSDFTATLTAPDSYGRGTIVTDFGLNFIYYALRGGVLRLIEADGPDMVSTGSAYGQGPPGENSSFSNAALTGSYAFYNSGSSYRGALGMAGQFTADGNGNLTNGYADTNEAGSVTAGTIAAQNAYTIAADGSGEMHFLGTQDVGRLIIFPTDPSLNLLDPNETAGGGGAFLLEIDTLAVGAGLIVPQATGIFQGNFAINLQVFSAEGEVDIVGQSAADGSGNLTGTVDINDTGTTNAGASLSGSFSADTANPGRWTGSITAAGAVYKSICYQIRPDALFIVDINGADIGNGFLEKTRL